MGYKYSYRISTAGINIFVFRARRMIYLHKHNIQINIEDLQVIMSY